MIKPIRQFIASVAIAALAIFAIPPRPVFAYVEVPYALGRVLSESTNALVVRVEKVDKEKNLIIYKKVADLKGVHPTDTIKHNIGHGGFHPREWQFVMAAAEPGKLAIIFHNNSASETCMENYWYQAYPGGEWWNMSHGEPYLLRSYCGKPEKLASLIPQMLQGKEVVVPCMVDGDKNALQLRTAKIQRMKASLRIQDYDSRRDFAGWGGDEFRALAGMPAFQQYGGLTRVDPGAIGVIAADIDGDGKTDICIYGEDKVAVLRSAGNTMEDVTIPYTGGARAAAFADYNGDGKPDLLLATPTGPRLLTNTGGAFKDDTALLPKEPYYNLTAAAFADFDGDGKPDILLANGFLGLRLYRNVTIAPSTRPVGLASASATDSQIPLAKASPTASSPSPRIRSESADERPPAFIDISDSVGLGVSGLANQTKGDRLLIADINNDGRPDFLYLTQSGPILAINTPQGFIEAKDSGLSFTCGKITPAFSDLDGDKFPDLLVPQNGRVILYHNDGTGHFTDITSKSGDLAMLRGNFTSVFACDFNNTGRPDILLGALKSSNRYLKYNGPNRFADATDSIGFYQRLFNTRAILAADLNKDGILDLIMNNEGQEPAVLIGAPSRVATTAIAPK